VYSITQRNLWVDFHEILEMGRLGAREELIDLQLQAVRVTLLQLFVWFSGNIIGCVNKVTLC